MPDEGFTELAGPREALRRFHPDDLATFVAYRSCERVARFQSWDAPYPHEEGERFIQEIAKQHPEVLANPEPSAFFLGFGENALNFELRAWVADIGRLVPVKSEVAVALAEAFEAAGILPQR